MLQVPTFRAALWRLTLAVTLAFGLGAPHRAAPAEGAVMVICGAAGSYSVPLDPGAPQPPAHDGACCLTLCSGTMASVVPAVAAPVTRPSRAAPPPRFAPRPEGNPGAMGARGPPGTV